MQRRVSMYGCRFLLLFCWFLGGWGLRPAMAGPEASVKRLLCVRVDFGDLPGEPVSQADAEKVLGQLDEFVWGNSRGRGRIEFKLTPVLRMPESHRWYCERGWTAVLQSAIPKVLREAGIEPGEYDSTSVITAKRETGGEAVRGRDRCVIFGQGFDINLVLRRLPSILGVAPATASGHPFGAPFDPAAGSSSGGVEEVSRGVWNTRYQVGMGWLPLELVQRVEDFGTFSLNAFDVDNGDKFTSVALEIPAGEKSAYWVETRRGLSDHSRLAHSLLIHKTPYRPKVGAELIDLTPGSKAGLWDAGLLPGRTFSDFEAGVHITSLEQTTQPFGEGLPAELEAGKPKPIPVMVRLGNFEKNRAPEVSLGGAEVQVTKGGFLKLHAEATDADGDNLAYSWDFGDRTYAGCKADVEKSWQNSGEYAVRCTVTDMKGGVKSAVTIVTVREPRRGKGYLRVSGRATLGGKPAAGIELEVDGRPWGTTAEDGTYIIPGLEPAAHELRANYPNFGFVPVGFSNPLKLTKNVMGADFREAPLPDKFVGLSVRLPNEPTYDRQRHCGLSACVAGDTVHLFTRGNDGAIWTQNRKGNEWTNWEYLGGEMTSPPTAVSWAPGRVDLFARSGPHKLMHKFLNQGRWSNWEAFEFDGPEDDAPGVCSWGPNRLDLFQRDNDGGMWHRFYAGNWSGWEFLGGKLTSAPVAVCWEADRIDIVGNGAPGKMEHLFYARRWSGWESLGMPADLLPGLSMNTWGPGRLDIWGRGVDGTVRHFWYDQGWHPWENLGGVTVSVPTVISRRPLTLVVLAATDTGETRQLIYQDTWKKWVTLSKYRGGESGPPEVPWP